MFVTEFNWCLVFFFFLTLCAGAVARQREFGARTQEELEEKGGRKAEEMGGWMVGGRVLHEYMHRAVPPPSSAYALRAMSEIEQLRRKMPSSVTKHPSICFECFFS